MNQQQQSGCFRELHAILQQQAEAISNYIDYLQLVKNAVAQNQTDELNRLLSQNSSHIAPIEKIQLNQADLIQRYGYHQTEQGLEQLIESCDQAEQLHQLKQALSEQLKQLEKSLLINDLLIRKNQERVRQSVRILSGHGNHQHGTTYSRQGNPSSSEDDKHSLALA